MTTPSTPEHVEALREQAHEAAKQALCDAAVAGHPPAGWNAINSAERSRAQLLRAIDALAAALRPQAAPAEQPDMLLFEHEDGRYAVAQAGAAFLVGEPAWHRLGPVTVHAPLPQPEAATPEQSSAVGAAEPVAAPVQPVAAMVDAETHAYAEGRSDQFEDDCTAVRLLFENLDDADVMGSGFINTTRVRELLDQFDIPATVECSGLECTRPECGAMGCTADQINTAREQRIAAVSQTHATPPVSVERDAARYRALRNDPEVAREVVSAAFGGDSDDTTDWPRSLDEWCDAALAQAGDKEQQP